MIIWENQNKSMSKKISFYVLLYLSGYLGASGQSYLVHSDLKYKETKVIFDKLTHSFSNGLHEPQFEIAKKGPMVYGARFQDNPRPTIIIDEEILIAAKELGYRSTSALALIIGHELAHYYRRDNSYDVYGMASSIVDADKKRIEAMADFEACYHAQINGYDPSVFGKTLDLIYSVYKLPENIKGYFPKEFRKKAYDEKQKTLTEKTTFHNLGTALYLGSYFEESAAMFLNLSLDFPSREVWNNLGASYLQLGLQDMEYNSQEFILPIELDVKTRMKSTTRGMLSDDNVLKSITYLKKASLMDEEYWPAKINLACAYLLLGKYHSAIHVIEEGNNPPPDAFSVLGIANTRLKNLDVAKSNFQKASDRRAYGADYNLNLFNQNLDWWGNISNYYVEIKNYVFSWFSEEHKTPNTSLMLRKLLSQNDNTFKTSSKLVFESSGFGIIVTQTNDLGATRYILTTKSKPQLIVNNLNGVYLMRLTKGKINTLNDCRKYLGEPLGFQNLSNSDLAYYYLLKGQKIIFFTNNQKIINKWVTIK